MFFSKKETPSRPQIYIFIMQETQIGHGIYQIKIKGYNSKEQGCLKYLYNTGIPTSYNWAYSSLPDADQKGNSCRFDMEKYHTNIPFKSQSCTIIFSQYDIRALQ